MAAKKKAAPTAKPEVKLLKAPKAEAAAPVAEKPVKAPKPPKEPKAPKAAKAPVVIQPAPEPVVVEPVILQRDKAPHASASQVAELFTQIEEALAASQGQRQSRPLRWALKSLAMAKETAARHFSLL